MRVHSGETHFGNTVVMCTAVFHLFSFKMMRSV
jgi:hypothetical protein